MPELDPGIHVVETEARSQGRHGNTAGPTIVVERGWKRAPARGAPLFCDRFTDFPAVAVAVVAAARRSHLR